MFGFRRRKRARLLSEPIPDGWAEIMLRCVPLLREFEPSDRDRLAGIARVLISEKRFEGCGGLTVTEEMRVSIATQAGLLVLNLTGNFYPGLRSILVYPAGYIARVEEEDDGPLGIVTEDNEVRLGETWQEGSLVLSWSDVVRGGGEPHDGVNVVFHEFAHQLDDQSGAMDGAPGLTTPGQARSWAEVFSAEYKRLIRDVDRGRDTLIDPYGATHPAEFFAVATEAFFEQPRALRRLHPDLYDQLAGFYLQDPAERPGRRVGPQGPTPR